MYRSLLILMLFMIPFLNNSAAQVSDNCISLDANASSEGCDGTLGLQSIITNPLWDPNNAWFAYYEEGGSTDQCEMALGPNQCPTTVEECKAQVDDMLESDIRACQRRFNAARLRAICYQEANQIYASRLRECELLY